MCKVKEIKRREETMEGLTQPRKFSPISTGDNTANYHLKRLRAVSTIMSIGSVYIIYTI